MDDLWVPIGLLWLDLFIPASQSLKEKRMILKSLKDRLRARFNISVAEVDNLDKWQRSVFAVCAVGNEKRRLEGILEAVLSYVEDDRRLQVIDHRIQLV